ncbi:hypothetical protein [Nocardiopsis sp. HUAS JQ3]|uniref:hypothetical protein n=1 Tax=Nocardiopsis sp. HUAS JQ3 TaxID=3061629 RepID=UPI0023A9ECBF|nr:hypothetical protein [Nocardiopsis sp. HUAS JQ3]WDZ91568.1 hypothetical protein PV789_03080 [Nocardiopsis sp. HUAS JQ3]
MKFQLVEPAEPPEAPESASGAAAGSTFVPSVPGFPVLGAHEELAARMRDRSEELGTRLTRIIEAVRPAIHRMEAGIVRAERELADSGHGCAIEPPAGFRADRFSGGAGRTATAEPAAVTGAAPGIATVTAPEDGTAGGPAPEAAAPAPATNEEDR